MFSPKRTRGAEADPGFPGEGGVDPFWGGIELQRRRFLVKIYVKTNESGPMGGHHSPENFVCRSANAVVGVGAPSLPGSVPQWEILDPPLAVHENISAASLLYTVVYGTIHTK